MGKLVPNSFNLFVVVFVALGSAACTYGTSVIGTTIGQPSFFKTLGLAEQGTPGYSRTSQYIGAFNGLNSAGSAIGAVVCSFVADKWSRKHTIQGAAVVLILGAALCSGSVNVSMFLVARFINGLGIGALVTAIPMYQAEVSTPEGRGFMVSMHGVMSAVGYGLQAWVGFGVYWITADGSTSSFPWRFPIAFQIAPALGLLIGSPLLPYSPRWLMMKDRNDEAHEVLKRLHRTKGDPHDTLARKEFYQMRKQVELDRQLNPNNSSFEIFRTPANRKRAMVGFFLLFNNMFTGALVIANYGIILYTSLGMTGYMPLLLTTLMVSSTLPGNILCAFIVDKFGRRKFMLIGLIGILIDLIIETALEASFLGTKNKLGQDFAILFIFLFLTPFWSTFMDAPQFLYTSEIMPTHVRSQGIAVAVTGFYFAQIILLIAGPIALNNIGWKFFFVLIIPTFLNILFVYFLCPETKGRSLEDINALFGEAVAVHYYDANEEEQRELEKAVEMDELDDSGKHESGITSAHQEVESAKV
ncbi:MFS glucose transporter mfs1 [Hyphodiscus hymeniophilus]|uniref:MFS glucose transporter mfs1 n=1 Tax=Hyphodiscus hymeniophilus TaxID=353542 RepID=A0A9P7AU12_9HELO|nr:MFS glucose transporter mfs1 [Hyphodiscus hymeniophilus]